MARRDYYDVLEVTRSATPDELKRAYRRLASALHPDRNPDNPTAEEQFKEASEAYQVLSDPAQRARYDRFGHNAGARAQVDIADLGDIFEGIFGDVFGIGGFARKRRAAGRDLRVELDLTFEEAAFGVEKTVEVERRVACGGCQGSGARPGTKVRACDACSGTGTVRYQQGFFRLLRPCTACGGSGRLSVEPCPKCTGHGHTRVTQKIGVAIPSGVETGDVHRIPRMGDVGAHGAPAGDVHVHVRVAEHPLFVRSGDDVHCAVPVSFPAAALGAKIDVPTLDGQVKMRIPAGTQSGHVFRLRGKGIVRRGMRTRGDQIVTVAVEVPQMLTRRQRELVETLSKELGEEAHPQRRSFMEKLRGMFGG